MKRPLTTPWNAHKIADVEVGSFLSSGVDSSYVACSADVDKTFTVGFDNGAKYNEISYAKELSETDSGEELSARRLPRKSSGATSAKIQYHMDEPLADPVRRGTLFRVQHGFQTFEGRDVRRGRR